MKQKMILPEGAAVTTPTVKSVRPFGSSILVEMLNADEALGTKLYVKETTDVGAPQGYVLGIGPKLSADDIGVKIGDRVLLQGTYVPVPNFDGHKRARGIVEVHNIKAVLSEE